jgi:predicted nucleotidyltransferase
MNSPQQNLLNQITSLGEQDNNLAIVWLYGSRAKGTYQQDSDYDFAVAFNTFPDDGWEKRLQPEELKFKWLEKLKESNISIVDINNIPLPLAYSIIQQGKVIYCGDTLRLAREENRISSMWELDYMWHKKHFG